MTEQPDRYTTIEHPNLPGSEITYMCNRCGVWVLNRKLHNTWHQTH